MLPIRTNFSQNIGSALVFCATGQDVSHVIIDGNLIVQNHKLLNTDISNIVEHVNYVSEKIGKLFEEVKPKTL
jgi:hypothetical protein